MARPADEAGSFGVVPGGCARHRHRQQCSGQGDLRRAGGRGDFVRRCASGPPPRPWRPGAGSAGWGVVVTAVALSVQGIGMRGSLAARVDSLPTELASRASDLPLAWRPCFLDAPRRVGGGNYGTVWQYSTLAMAGDCSSAGRQRAARTKSATVALKFVPLNNFDTLRMMQCEAFVVRRFQGSEVVSLLGNAISQNGVDPSQRYYVLAMEAAERDLRNLLDERQLSPREALLIFAAVVRSVDAMHTEGFAHRDLKPANVLLFSDRKGVLSAKLGDFGLACPVKSREGPCLRCSGWAGTPPFLAPEYYQDNIDHVKQDKVDSWALGMLFYRMWFGNYPPGFREGMTKEEYGSALDGYRPEKDPALQEVRSRKRPRDGMPETNKTTAKVAQLLRRLLAQDPEVRSSVDSALWRVLSLCKEALPKMKHPVEMNLTADSFVERLPTDPAAVDLSKWFQSKRGRNHDWVQEDDEIIMCCCPPTGPSPEKLCRLVTRTVKEPRVCSKRMSRWVEWLKPPSSQCLVNTSDAWWRGS